MKTVEKEDENILLAQWFVIILSGVASGGQGGKLPSEEILGKNWGSGTFGGKMGKGRKKRKSG